MERNKRRSTPGRGTSHPSIADLEGHFLAITDKAIAAIIACEPKPDRVFGEFSELVSFVRSVAFHEGRLLEWGIAAIARCNPDLLILPSDRPMPIVPAAVQLLKKNEWCELQGIRLPSEVHTTKTYTPDLFIANRARHAGLIIDVKRSLASYAESKLEDLRFRMMAVAAIASSWLSERQGPVLVEVGTAIIDGADLASDHDKGVFKLSEVGDLLEVENAGLALTRLRDIFSERTGSTRTGDPVQRGHRGAIRLAALRRRVRPGLWRPASRFERSCRSSPARDIGTKRAGRLRPIPRERLTCVRAPRLPRDTTMSIKSKSQTPKVKRKRALQRRFSDVGLTAARALMVRGLRRDGLHRALSGRPTVIAFILASAADADIYMRSIRHLIELLTATRWPVSIDVLHWSTGKSTRRNRDPEAAVTASLTANDFVFGFASRRNDIPPLFRIAAEGIVELSPLDLPTLRAAMKNAKLGLVQDDVLEDVLHVPLALLGALTSRPHSPHVIRQRFIRAAARYRSPPAVPSPDGASHDAPSLENLAGFGDAATWGKELAKDLEAFQVGELPWTQVDRGILLSGPTGTGKTTFARALANTCDVPIHVHSLARWQAQGYLNDLLWAMRRAFDDATADAPCILFIDEIDSFGDRTLLAGRNENYEREVINAFLECLDGADGREGVIVVGATNMPEKIDAAIMRPGRLGKHVRIPLPDAAARIAILRYYLGDAIPREGIAEIAKRLEGASGAALEQIVRDARRHSRARGASLCIEDVEPFLPARRVQGNASFAVTCVHEAGHIVVGHLLGLEAGQCFVEGFAVRELMHDGTSGWTVFRREPALHRTGSSYLAEIAILLAGLAAETVRFASFTDSAGGNDESDLRCATLIAARMELTLGLGVSLVYAPCPDPADVFRRLAHDPRLRRRVSVVLETCMRRATDILTANASFAREIADLLSRHGAIAASEVEAVSHRYASSPSGATGPQGPPDKSDGDGKT